VLFSPSVSYVTHLACASASKGDPTSSAHQGLDFPMRIPGFGGVPIGADGDSTMLIVFVNLSEC
jgi:hypothetical protein